MTIQVFLTQVAISLVVVTLYHLWVSRKKQPEPVTPVAAQPKTLPAAEPMPPEILAVIAAAIAVVVGRPHRVVSVQPTAAQTPEVNVWAMEGRMEQFMSHKIR